MQTVPQALRAEELVSTLLLGRLPESGLAEDQPAPEGQEAMTRRVPKVRRLWEPQEWLTKARREQWWKKPPNSLERQAWERIKRLAPRKPKADAGPGRTWTERVKSNRP